MHVEHKFEPRFVAAAVRLVAAAGIAGLAEACTPTHAYLRQGDAHSAEVSYAGDLERATRVAREHCGRFERVPKLVDTGPEVAYFDCVKP
jgi:hypothetical protein